MQTNGIHYWASQPPDWLTDSLTWWPTDSIPPQKLFIKAVMVCSLKESWCKPWLPTVDFGLEYVLHFFSIYGILKSKEEQSMQLTVNFPDSLPDLLQETKQEFEFEVKMALAAKLFQMKRISSGIAASIVGIPRTTFLLNLHKFGVPMIDLDKDELISDVKNAWKKKDSY